MTEIITPENVSRPPMPDAPPGYQYVWVNDRTDNHGKTTKAHWRRWPLHIKSRTPKRGRPRKSERPQFTGQTHAQHVYDQLVAPLVWFTAINMSEEHTLDTKIVLGECLNAIVEARRFIARFITIKTGDE